MSVMQPKPRPRAIFPASQPAIRPRRSQETKPCDSNQIPTVLCVGTCAANMRPPWGTRIVSEFTVQAIDLKRAGKPALLGSRLLLRHAVHRAKSQHEIAAGDSHHFTIWKQTRECIECDAIVRVIKSGHDHDLVGNVKIRVTRGKPLPVEIDRCRDRMRFHAKGAAVLLFHGFQQREMFLKGGIVGSIGSFSKMVTNVEGFKNRRRSATWPW